MTKILLNILTHGDELAGLKVADTIRVLYPEIIGHGLDIQIANERAFRSSKRYIDKDLNRVFPGNPTGCYEEIIANELRSIISSYDLVVDVHSTESGSSDIVIVTKFDSNTKETLRALSPKYVLFMNILPDRSLISCARLGIAFEMGSDKAESTVTNTVKGIEFLLFQSKLIGRKEPFGLETKYFEVFGQISKSPGSLLEAEIKNFAPISKGQMFARTADGSPIFAEFDFYPVIFGNNNYETIFGFAACLRN